VPDESKTGRADQGVTGKSGRDALEVGAVGGSKPRAVGGNKALGRGLSALARPASAGRESTGTGSSPR